MFVHGNVAMLLVWVQDKCWVEDREGDVGVVVPVQELDVHEQYSVGFEETYWGVVPRVVVVVVGSTRGSEWCGWPSLWVSVLRFCLEVMQTVDRMV